MAFGYFLRYIALSSIFVRLDDCDQRIYQRPPRQQRQQVRLYHSYYVCHIAGNLLRQLRSISIC